MNRLTRTLFVLVAICFPIVPTIADEFPSELKGQTAAQLQKFLNRAPAENMIVDDIRVQATRTRILFDASFQANDDQTAWTIQTNIDNRTLKKSDADLQMKGYKQAFVRSVRFGGKTYYTAVWKKSVTSAEIPLVIPAIPVPVSGTDDRAFVPIDDMLKSFITQHNVAGATLAIARNGRVLYSRGFGYSDVPEKTEMAPDAAMRIASISKPMTAVAILTLVERGKLQLDDAVLPILQRDGYPRLKSSADQRWNQITVRHLLQHSAGFDRSVSSDPMFEVGEVTQLYGLRRLANTKDLIRHEMTQQLDFDPGQRYAYSNIGYCILGRVIESVAGMPYDEFVAENILKPSGMVNTYQGKTRLEDRGEGEVRYHMQKKTMHVPVWSTVKKGSRRAASLPAILPEVEAPYGRWDLEVMDSHGAWVSTAPDLVRMICQLEDSEAPLLSEASLETMLARPQLAAPVSDSTWYGCGWQVRPRGAVEDRLDGHNIWHSGAIAGTSTLLVRRWDGFSWAVLFNTDRSKNGNRLSGLIDPMIHKAVDAVDWPETTETP